MATEPELVAEPVAPAPTAPPEVERGESPPMEPAPPPVASPPPPVIPPPPAAQQGRTDAAAPPEVERPGTAAAPPPQSGRRRYSTRARAGAIVALAAVIVALWLLLHESHSSGHAKSASATPSVVKVLIPEGETRKQIDQIARKRGLKGSYLAASARSPSGTRYLARYGAPSGTSSLEGFLFPATYDMLAHAPASQLVGKQITAFKENFGGAEVARARAERVTPYQLLTIASMVEREALLPGDRPKVAAVIYNRLRGGMPLEVDATIRYALNDFTHPLTEAQLKTESPYNTRTHRGLPPTPISNPGLASIEAAARPARVSYLYYVAGADGCGDLRFSTAYAQFQRDEAAYKQALERNGGRVPTCHKK
jgi:cell division protein YceG involved in septum cleavage